jgi:hypothetical protein
LRSCVTIITNNYQPFHARHKEYLVLLWETRDTRFPRKTIPRYVESVSYNDFESQSVEDEFLVSALLPGPRKARTASATS